jgi:hypothetical protein
VSDAERTAAALAIWQGAADSADALNAYCAARALPGLEKSTALRWRADVRHPDERGFFPAMVAAVVDVAGQFIACHRTYLRRDGSGKADLACQRASKGPTRGGAIRLDTIAPELVIGGRILGLPAWSAVSAGNMADNLALPGEVRSVVIAADPGKPGEDAAQRAAHRWAAEGRRVRIARTGREKADFNDLLMERAHG